MKASRLARAVGAVAAGALPFAVGGAPAGAEPSKFAHAGWELTFTNLNYETVTCQFRGFAEHVPDFDYANVEFHVTSLEPECIPLAMEIVLTYTDVAGERRRIYSKAASGAREAVLRVYDDVSGGVAADLTTGYNCRDNPLTVCGTSRHLVPK